MLIRIYTEILDRDAIEHVCEKIGGWMPKALITGCSSNGNIVNGDFSGGSFAVVCTMFEYSTTKAEVLQYSLAEKTQEEVTSLLCEEVAKREWVKGVELLITIRGMSVTAFCDGLSRLPEHIQVFGGGAFCEDLNNDNACVFSNVGGYQEKAVLFVLLGGGDLQIKTSFLTGWKPVGAYLNVTKAEGPELKELNNRPAYETYYKYLHIRNDEHFFNNTLEFPFLYHYNDIDILRAPIASNPDGSLTMTANIPENVKARIAYGDPATILTSARTEGNKLLDFSPECIQVFSCAARRTFWGNTEAGKETEAYQIVAPTSGFYTSGEFLRTGRFVNQHNVTQVIAALREGEPRPYPEKKRSLSSVTFEGKVSMINRMATFIKATTDELEEANRRLREQAVTDALTGIGNKTAYFDKVHELDELIRTGRAAFSVVVFDMNGLKAINDNYSHECGDLAIIDLGNVLKSVFGKDNLYRIGGDEFIAVLDNTSGEKTEELFGLFEMALERENRVVKKYVNPLSVSKGYSSYEEGFDANYSAVFRRADQAMYENKTAYYKLHDRRRKNSTD